jgi:hypothetical protein
VRRGGGRAVGGAEGEGAEPSEEGRARDEEDQGGRKGSRQEGERTGHARRWMIGGRLSHGVAIGGPLILLSHVTVLPLPCK